MKRACLSLLFCSAAAGCSLIDAIEGRSLRIERFRAEPEGITRGQSAILSWRVEGADAIAIDVEGGGELIQSTEPEGGITVSPIATQAYVLTARQENGDFLRAAATVTIIDERPVIERFTADPPRILYGQTVTLAWSVRNAERVSISAKGEQLIAEAPPAAETSVEPAESTDYVLTAQNGEEVVSETVTVLVEETRPVIVSFTATPNPAQLGSISVLAIEVRNADFVQIISDRGDLVYEGEYGRTTFDVSVDAPMTSYRLSAGNPYGLETRDLVVLGEELAIETFIATPPWFLDTDPTIDLTWLTNAKSTRLTVDGAPAADFPGTPSGRLTLALQKSSDVTLFAASDANEISRTLRAFALVPEVEPNETPGTAQPIYDFGIAGAIGSTMDADWFRVSVPQSGNISVRLADLGGGCSFGGQVTLYQSNAAMRLGTGADARPQYCIQVDPRRDTFAADLAAGTYHFEVTAPLTANRAEYALIVEVGAPVCGNGIVERGTGEQCDDGARIDGDGCDGRCRIEPLAIVRGPPGSLVVTGTISPAGDRDYYRLELAAPAVLTARAETPSFGMCLGDVELRVFDESFSQTLFESLGSEQICPALGEASLPAGAYILMVNEQSDDEEVVYQLDLSLMP